jgi:hypothetical protein
MPRGPKGEKRPADVIGNAVMIGRIATGEIEDITTEDGKNAAAVALGVWAERRELRALPDPAAPEALRPSKYRYKDAHPPSCDRLFRVGREPFDIADQSAQGKDQSARFSRSDRKQFIRMGRPS